MPQPYDAHELDCFVCPERKPDGTERTLIESLEPTHRFNPSLSQGAGRRGAFIGAP